MTQHERGGLDDSTSIFWTQTGVLLVPSPSDADLDFVEDLEPLHAGGGFWPADSAME
jgi:hypothetical protein